jgi:antitoxin MazE
MRSMELPVIKIGNSKGIILSKTLLEKYGLRDKVEINMKEDHIEIRSVRPPREGWDKAFREMHKQGDDALILGTIPGEDILEDWDWEDGTDAV